MSPVAVAVAACGAPAESPDADLCAQAQAHLETCFPDQAVEKPEACDSELAQEIIESSCDQLGDPGKADWWCTPWTWWLCGVGGAVQTLAYDQTYPHDIATDAQAVYWCTYEDDGAIRTSGLDGGDQQTLAGGQQNPTQLADDDTHVFWINWGTADSGTSSIRRVAKSGGAVSTLVDQLHHIWAFALDATEIYFSVEHEIWVLPKQGGSPELLVSTDGAPVTLVADETHLYWKETYGSGPIRRIDKAGTTLETLAVDQHASALALDATSVYYVDLGVVKKLDKGGGSPMVLGSDGSSGSGSDIVLSGDHVYWVDSMEGALRRVPLTGGPVEAIATGQKHPEALALQGQSIFWVNVGTYIVLDYLGDGSVKKKQL